MAEESFLRVPHQYGVSLVRRALLGMFCTAALLASAGVHADECESSTPPRKLGLEKSTIEFETLDQKRGSYVAALKNGDLVMASFSQCGLGMHAHFYSRNPLAKEQRSKTLRGFLAAVLPSQAAYESLAKQLNSTTDLADKKTQTLTSAHEETETHTFEFQASESPLYHTVLHYRWNPPLH